MARGVTTVERSLTIRNGTPSAGRKSLGFECIECGEAVVHIKPKETAQLILSIWNAIPNAN